MTVPRQIVGAAIVDSLDAPRRLLAARRTRPAAYAGQWEFPGGKVEPGESCEDALLRELDEELGVSARLGKELEGPLAEGWPLTGTAAMRVWFAAVASGQPRPLQDHDQLRWVGIDSAELLELEWIPADRPIVLALRQHVAARAGGS
ncbi:MAG: NUDIX domain-containing protein [Arthrobacter sp.]|uniref:NUDIX domain-containing protein n=1 Tax=Arthrobacter sp. TaxID=1667 RepID=UPI003475B18D